MSTRSDEFYIPCCSQCDHANKHLGRHKANLFEQAKVALCNTLGHQWVETGQKRKRILEIHMIGFETTQHRCQRCGLISD